MTTAATAGTAIKLALAEAPQAKKAVGNVQWMTKIRKKEKGNLMIWPISGKITTWDDMKIRMDLEFRLDNRLPERLLKPQLEAEAELGLGLSRVSSNLNCPSGCYYLTKGGAGRIAAAARELADLFETTPDCQRVVEIIEQLSPFDLLPAHSKAYQKALFANQAEQRKIVLNNISVAVTQLRQLASRLTWMREAAPDCERILLLCQ